jgi:hypothetical protein
MQNLTRRLCDLDRLDLARQPDAASRSPRHSQSLDKGILQAVRAVGSIFEATEEIDAVDFAFLANDNTGCAELRLD